MSNGVAKAMMERIDQLVAERDTLLADGRTVIRERDKALAELDTQAAEIERLRGIINEAHGLFSTIAFDCEDEDVSEQAASYAVHVIEQMEASL